jgi:hypothetical protein
MKHYLPNANTEFLWTAIALHDLGILLPLAITSNILNNLQILIFLSKLDHGRV